MLKIGVQTKNIVMDDNPAEGFKVLARAGFSCADFSLNGYLVNTMLYKNQVNVFFDRSVSELEEYFKAHKEGAAVSGIEVNQMHMPYPIYIPTISREINDYLCEQVMPKSMAVCDYFGCPNIVVHGLKMRRYLGTEEAEWMQTEAMLDKIAPMAKEMGITICVENLYESIAGHIVEGPCCDARKAAERIDRFNEKYHAPVLGFCFDTGHANLVGIDFEDFIVKLGERLKVLHVHDNDGISDLHQIPFTFTKTRENNPSTDWEGFLSGLRRIGYKGVISFETAPVLASFPEEMKEDTLKFIARIGKHFSEKTEKGE